MVTRAQLAMTREQMIAALELALAELGRMCERQWAGKPAIEWSIPARPEVDSDLVIHRAITSVAAALTGPPSPQVTEALKALQADIVRRWEARMRPELNTPTAGDILEFMGHVNEAINAALAAQPPVTAPAAMPVAPECGEHGVMVADDEMGRSWHCACCSFTFPAATEGTNG